MKAMRMTGLLPLSLAAALFSSVTPAAAVDKDCVLDAEGQSCLFDLTATTGGTVTVCSIPRAAGARFRNTTAKLDTAGAASKVGATTIGACTGTVTQTVVAGGKYLAIITYESPLPGSFSRVATVRINGPVTVAGPRLQTSGEPQTCTQITETAAETVADVDTALCGGLYRCRFSPAGDTDLFNWTVPTGTVGWLKIAGPSTYGSQWCLYNPSGALIECQPNLDTTATLVAGTHRILTRDTYNYTGDYYLSVQGISGAHRCGQPIVCGDVKQGTFATRGDTDTFTFTTAAARPIDLKITGPSTYGSQWCVFNASGAAVGDCTSGQGSVTLPAAGTYTIGVKENYNYTGAYNLSLQCL